MRSGESGQAVYWLARFPLIQLLGKRGSFFVFFFFEREVKTASGWKSTWLIAVDSFSLRCSLVREAEYPYVSEAVGRGLFWCVCVCGVCAHIGGEAIGMWVENTSLNSKGSSEKNCWSVEPCYVRTNAHIYQCVGKEHVTLIILSPGEAYLRVSESKWRQRFGFERGDK